VLERYVNLATRAGVCQAVFLEGGLTKDGTMRDPRLGFLDYMLRDYHPTVDKDIVFVPVGINYDRVIEDKSLVRGLNPELVKRSKWFVIKTSLRFFFKTVFMNRKKRWGRFGYASVNFGKPVSAKEYCKQKNTDFSQMEQEARFVGVEKLANTLSQNIKDVIPVLPTALMSEIVLSNKDEWKSELELKADAVKRISQLEREGAPINISASACEGVLSTALSMLEGRGFVTVEDNLYRANEDAMELLSYYANSIAHWK
jgi:glycerol-3-phosphate O-acyltransferase